jgi:ferredoxin-NADP reductase
MPAGERLRVRVARKTSAADGVAAFDLESIDGSGLPAWTPGAHIEVSTGIGVPRQYSLCGAVAAGFYRIAVLRVADGRGGSAWMHDQLVVGDALDIRPPRNNFELKPASEYLFVAGGIGITPILPMVRAAEDSRVPWRLVYGGRTIGSMAFTHELRSLAGAVNLVPQDVAGVLDLDAVLGPEVPGRRVYCCGPEPLIEAMELRFSGRGGEYLHLERFQSEQVSREGDRPFEVEIGSTGERIAVAPGISIIDALADAGVEVEFSCREGTCGTCETGVLAGVPDHRDAVLSADERAANDCMMLCVGRCVEGPLVLDL